MGVFKGRDLRYCAPAVTLTPWLSLQSVGITLSQRTVYVPKFEREKKREWDRRSRNNVWENG